jgi:hypothetical protein
MLKLTWINVYVSDTGNINGKGTGNAIPVTGHEGP